MIRVILVALILALPTAAVAQMYKWVDKDGKTHYSDQPPPPDAKPQAAPSASSAPISGEPAEGRFRVEEQNALVVLCGIAFLEFSCALDLQRLCTLEELVPGGLRGAKGFPKDPRSDPNYHYTVSVRGEDITMTASPRKAGLAAFQNNGDGVTYSMKGPATPADKKVQGGVNCEGFKK